VLRQLRDRLGLSQAAFAERFHINLRTLQDWAQARRVPDQVARAYLRIIERNPEAVIAALQDRSHQVAGGAGAEPRKKARSRREIVKTPLLSSRPTGPRDEAGQDSFGNRSAPLPRQEPGSIVPTARAGGCR
jgi:transcriptional regulator with XRE-family HTH domain